MIVDTTDINFLHSKTHIIKTWLKNFPISIRKNVKNILSIDSENADLDLEISTYFKNCEKYYIVQSEYNSYKKSIDTLFGNFKFKISYSDIYDYELDPKTSYDIIIIFTKFNLDEDITSFVKKAFEFISTNGKIMIISCSHDKFVLESRNFFNLNFISDQEFIKNLDFKCRIFNTHVSTFLNINDLNKIEMLKLTNEKLDDNKIEEFKQFALEKYGSSVCVPISLIILSKIKILEPKLIK
jgi:hypothetical protein